MSTYGPAALAAAAAAALMSWLGLYGFAWNDYDFEASAAMRALTGGHFVRFLELSPAYGGSLVVRAPFALLAGLWGGGELAVYRLVSIPCLAAAAVLAVWLVGRMRAERRTLLARGCVIGLIVANPITLRALEIGHAEELLAAVLCVAALLAARGRHPVWAGLLIGLAIANKTWALVALPPLVATLELQRPRALAVAAVVAAVALAPLAIAQGGSFVTDNASPGQSSAALVSAPFQPWQLWWWAGRHGKVVRGMNGQVKRGYRSPPPWLTGFPRLLIVALAFPLTWLWRRRPGPPRDLLLLLALLLLIRCFLDPWNNVYYAVPFVIALTAWEARAHRLPAISLFATASLWVLFQALPAHLSPDAQSAVYDLSALAAAAAIAVRLYGPPRWRWLAAKPLVPAAAD